MKAKDIIRKHITIEIVALLVLIFSIVYAFIALNQGSKNEIRTIDGFVTVLDDSKFEKPTIKSDGQGIEAGPIQYTITNNNNDEREYKIIISSKEDEKTLNQIKVSIDDLYVYNLTELEKDNDGYIIRTYKLGPGYTKNHIIRIWYKLGTKESLVKDIKFEYTIKTTK